jgi:hypothetical protein
LIRFNGDEIIRADENETTNAKGKTMTTNEAKVYLTDKIAEALTYDARGDVVLRDQVVSRLLGDEFGLSLRTIRRALKEAGLIR